MSLGIYEDVSDETEEGGMDMFCAVLFVTKKSIGCVWEMEYEVVCVFILRLTDVCLGLIIILFFKTKWKINSKNKKKKATTKFIRKNIEIKTV